MICLLADCDSQSTHHGERSWKPLTEGTLRTSQKPQAANLALPSHPIPHLQGQAHQMLLSFLALLLLGSGIQDKAHLNLALIILTYLGVPHLLGHFDNSVLKKDIYLFRVFFFFRFFGGVI